MLCASNSLMGFLDFSFSVRTPDRCRFSDTPSVDWFVVPIRPPSHQMLAGTVHAYSEPPSQFLIISSGAVVTFWVISLLRLGLVVSDA